MKGELLVSDTISRTFGGRHHLALNKLSERVIVFDVDNERLDKALLGALETRETKVKDATGVTHCRVQLDTVGPWPAGSPNLAERVALANELECFMVFFLSNETLCRERAAREVVVDEAAQETLVVVVLGRLGFALVATLAWWWTGVCQQALSLEVVSREKVRLRDPEGIGRVA